jgi:hypothetical protein
LLLMLPLMVNLKPLFTSRLRRRAFPNKTTGGISSWHGDTGVMTRASW